VAKSILLKIAKKHAASFHPVIQFFVANINYEEEIGKTSIKYYLTVKGKNKRDYKVGIPRYKK
jgi:hypothetical protein